jgi:hypothetical protein
LRRRLRSAERLSERATALALGFVKTPFSSVSASLCSVTRRDQRLRRDVLRAFAMPDQRLPPRGRSGLRHASGQITIRP